MCVATLGHIIRGRDGLPEFYREAVDLERLVTSYPSSTQVIDISELLLDHRVFVCKLCEIGIYPSVLPKRIRNVDPRRASRLRRDLTAADRYFCCIGLRPEADVESCLATI